MLDCVLIVISYRSARDVAGLLATVPAAVEGLSWQVLIVNNAPSDDLDQSIAPFREATLIEAGANLGYAGGINLGLGSALPSRWTVFLNPDLRLAPRAITIMTESAADEHAIVPRIVDDEGLAQSSLRREPTILGSLGDALFGDHWAGRPPFLGETVREAANYEQAAAVDWATGAALLVPTRILREVGDWDAERFFLYSEETDYCRRLRESDVEVHFIPAAVVSHRGGGSGTSDQLYALLEVNRVRYFQKWHGALASYVFATVAVLNNALRIHRSRSRAALRALIWPRARAALPGGRR